MKLRFVAFKLAVDCGSGLGHRTELRSPPTVLEFDPKTNMVIVGLDGWEVPRECVRSWQRDRRAEPPQSKMRCIDCGREFNNAQGLGGHRRKAHGVKAA